MSICQLSPNNYCKRHQRVHVGRELQLSQMDTPQGEKYRQLWDAQLKGEPYSPPPSLLQKGAAFVKAISRHATNRFKTVNSEEKGRRLKICESCPERRGNAEEMASWQCNACGCYLNIKAEWESEECPLNKWVASPPQEQSNSSGCGCNS